ncbi:hypothetical protein Baya_12880 [Bagarius yarrelli]|uniref:Peroxisomal membrane protein PEX13 n=1 Tax=Bagarius yarrelli TaxID=175774 RepID=A0A556V4D1_BAGYA|nr:hypothetical protein Baya_12880 [Bagarius yarrelli]
MSQPPPKPWERRIPGAIGAPLNYRSTDFAPGNALTSSGPPSMTRLAPPIPPRPIQQTYRPAYSSFPSSYSPFSSSPYGGYSPYSPYSYSGLGYNRFTPEDVPPSRFVQQAEESSRGAFQSIESIVHAFSSVSMMLDATFSAVYNSFRAVLDVANHFSRLRVHFTKVLSAFALVRTLRYLYRRLQRMLGMRSGTEVEDLWEDSAATAVVPGGTNWASGEDDHVVARAEYDFTAASEEEISLQAGDMLNLAPKEQQPRVRGWLLASADGQTTGLVPANYVKILGKRRGKRQAELERLAQIQQEQQVLPSAPAQIMNRLYNLNNNFPYDNSLMVLDMVLRSLWGTTQPINWENVARLVPGFTPKECARRFDELKNAGSFPLVDEQCNQLTGASGSPSEPLSAYIRSTLDLTGDTGEPRTNQSMLSVSGVSVTPALRGDGAETENTASTEHGEKEDRGKSPVMVIHVCDEAKNLKQDFECPRDLLVREMRYFAEYLSMDSQRWEEVDISVHCDIQIFDWLMNYVKRNSEEDKPTLEPSNVISILISSEFLKMDALVEECIQYCHEHMSAIVATPCNMNCINSNLASRIALLFTHNQADDIKDKKDKFKSKVFQKKIEKLFDPCFKNPDSPGNAATLYRCGLCLKLLTKDTERKISCVPGKINIDDHGDIVYTHSRQKGWDVHEYLNSLFEELKSWVLVYWRIWGTINYLNCSCCKQVFLCCDLAQCRYHPEAVVYPGVGADSSEHGVGIYPCCKQRALRFDPAAMPTGCEMRDHVVNAAEPGDREGNVNFAQTRILNDLLLHRDTVCTSSSADTDRQSLKQHEQVQDCDITLDHAALSVNRAKEVTARQQALLSEDEDYTTGSEVTEDEVGDEDDTSKKQAVKKPRKPGKSLKRQVSSPSILHRERAGGDKGASKDSTPFTVSMQKSKWDSSRSMRFNQDAQREEGL